MLVKLSDIKIGNRFRQDLGDISPLIESIKRHGLLHPIVITEQSELICGRRRIEALTELGKSCVEVRIVSLQGDKFEAEADENIVRKNFTVEEIAQIDQFYREKEEVLSRERMLAGKQIRSPSGKFPRGRAREKIAARVGVSDRTLEKIRVIRQAALQDPRFSETWEKVGKGKIKVDKGYNYVKRLKKIQEAKKVASLSHSKSSLYDLKLGPMQEKGLEIADNSIDLIFTDPPYNEESIPLYGELASTAQRVLKPGGSLITFVGHYALFEINKLFEANSNLQYQWQLIVKHNGHTAKMWKQRVWPKYKPLLWYYKPKDGEKGPTMYTDMEDLIESQPADKTMHDWEQSPIEAEHIIKPLTVEGQIVLDPFMGYGTNGIAALELKRKFIGIEIDKEHYARAAQRLAKFR